MTNQRIIANFLEMNSLSVDYKIQGKDKCLVEVAGLLHLGRLLNEGRKDERKKIKQNGQK